MRNVKKELEKCKHPNSRKFTALVKQSKKESTRKKSKVTHALKQSLVGEKLFWFKERLIPNVPCYSPDQTEDIITRYLSRFDEELDDIRIKNSCANRKNRQHANREGIINMTIKREKEEFNTCGIEMPDLMNVNQVNVLRQWDGEMKYLQNFKLRRIGKRQLVDERQRLQLVHTKKEEHFDERRTVSSGSNLEME